MECVKDPLSFPAANGATNVGPANGFNKAKIYLIIAANTSAAALTVRVQDKGGVNSVIDFHIPVPANDLSVVNVPQGIEYHGQLVMTPSAACDLLVGLNA